MAEITPFAALRFTQNAGPPSGYCCPPYNAVPGGGQALLYAISPYNAVRLEFPRDENPYAEAAAAMAAWRREDVLQQDTAPAFFFYRRACRFSCKQTESVDGLFACVGIGDGITSSREVLPATVQDRYQMLEVMPCDVAPLHFLYRDEDGVTAARLVSCVSSKPLYSFDLYHVTHTVWRLDDPALMESLRVDFFDRTLAAADACRYEAVLRHRRANPGLTGRCLALLTDGAQPGLQTFPPHGTIHRTHPLTGLVMHDLC